MNKSIVISAMAVVVLALSCSNDNRPTASSGPDRHTSAENNVGNRNTSDLKKEALLKAYPDFIARIANDSIYFSDGSAMVYDDHREKSFIDLLDNPDPEDMFFTPYDSRQTPPAYLSDAGRQRSSSLLGKMYGDREEQVRANLATVDWFGQKVRFATANGAADSLRKVVADLTSHPELKSLLRCSGTFYWRKVRGADRLSAHSYGIAIDIGVDHSDYWRWNNPRASETDKIVYKNRMPRELVDIFERHGFIWGGAWYHYDTMHFEFRPEIINYGRFAKS